MKLGMEQQISTLLFSAGLLYLVLNLFPREYLSGRSLFWRLCLPVFVLDAVDFYRTRPRQTWRYPLFAVLLGAAWCWPLLAGVPYFTQYGFPVWLPGGWLGSFGREFSFWLQVFADLAAVNFFSLFYFRHSLKARALLRAILLHKGLPTEYVRVRQLDYSRVLFEHAQPVPKTSFAAAREALAAASWLDFEPGSQGISFPREGAIIFCAEWSRAKRQRREPNITGAVRPMYWYAMVDDSNIRVKIGRSVDPWQRLKQLGTANPSLQFYRRQIDGRLGIYLTDAASNEKKWHKLFDQQRAAGLGDEWFIISEDLLAVLETSQVAEVPKPQSAFRVEVN